MKRFIIFSVLFIAAIAAGMVSAVAAPAHSDDPFYDRQKSEEVLYDGPTLKLQRIYEHSELVVPSSFQGRKGKYDLDGISISFFERVEFRRDTVRTRLKGRSNRFDYDTDVDHINVMLWRSNADIPGHNSCMECHSSGDSAARTQFWIGRETRFIDPYPSVEGNATVEIADAATNKNFCEIRYWATHRQQLKLGVSHGRMRSFETTQDADSVWLGWSWHNHRDLTVEAEWRASKPELYNTRSEFTGAVSYKPAKGVHIGVKGGILPDGVCPYDLGYSDMGAVTVSTDINNPEDLPSIFQKLRNKQFGYYSIEARYEYAF